MLVIIKTGLRDIQLEESKVTKSSLHYTFVKSIHSSYFIHTMVYDV